MFAKVSPALGTEGLLLLPTPKESTAGRFRAPEYLVFTALRHKLNLAKALPSRTPKACDTRLQIPPQARSSCSCRWLNSPPYWPTPSQHPSPPCPSVIPSKTACALPFPCSGAAPAPQHAQEEPEPFGLTVKAHHELTTGSCPIGNHFTPAK